MVTLPNPTKILVGVAGFLNDWVYSREWGKIFWAGIPSVLLLGLATAVFIGGRLDRPKLAQMYVNLGAEEQERWETSLAQLPNKESVDQVENESQNSTTADGAVSDTPAEGLEKNQSDASEKKVQADAKELSPYAQMLFRRAHLIEPSLRTQYVIGATMWQRGAIANAKDTLEKIAPNDKPGFPPAHNVLAKIAKDEFARTHDSNLVPMFLHHAEYAMEYERVFPDVMLEFINLLWHQRRFETSLKFLQKAAEYNKDFNLLLVDRARQANQMVLFADARKKGIAYYREQLQDKPRSEPFKLNLAQLLVMESSGEAEAEQILQEALQHHSSKPLLRALSNVYRIRFSRQLEANKGKNLDMTLLEKALQVDPSNPEVAQTVATLIQSGIKASESLEAELNRVLASGRATVSTHSLLAELHLVNGQYAKSINHLEQVYRQAPASVKYANNLAYLYAKEGRLDDAAKVASDTLALIQKNHAEREPYVDELMDTLGMIFEAQKNISEAIAAYEGSLRLNPLRVETRVKLIRIYRKNGDEGIAKAHEEAIEGLEKAKAAAEQSAKQRAEQAIQSAGNATSKTDSVPTANLSNPTEPVPAAESVPENSTPESNSTEPK